VSPASAGLVRSPETIGKQGDTTTNEETGRVVRGEKLAVAVVEPALVEHGERVLEDLADAAERGWPPHRVRRQNAHQPPLHRSRRAHTLDPRIMASPTARRTAAARLEDWMFCNRKGHFLNPESISQLFDRVVQRSPLTCLVGGGGRIEPATFGS